MNRISKIFFFCWMAGAVFIVHSCKKKDIKGEVITLQHTQLSLQSNSGRVVVPTGENFQKTPDDVTIPLVLRMADAAPRRFQVHVLVDSNTVRKMIADGTLENAMVLPEESFSLPRQLDVPFGVDSLAFNLKVNRTAMERNYHRTLVVAVQLDDPTKENTLSDGQSEVVVEIHPSEVIQPDEIHNIYFSSAGDTLFIPQPGVVYDQNATYLTVPVPVSLGGVAGSDFHVWVRANADTVQQLLAQGKLGGATLLQADTDYVLPDSLHYAAHKNESDLDVKVKVDVLKANLGGRVALGLTLDRTDRHLLDSARKTVVLVLDPKQLVESDVTNEGSTLSVQRENACTGEQERSPSLVDNNINSKFLLCDFSSPVWAQLAYDHPQVINAYSLTSANDAPERDPKDWQIQGSNNGTSWTVLDIREGESFLSRHETKKYTFPNKTPYSYYRLLITKNNGNSLMQVSEWRVFMRP